MKAALKDTYRYLRSQEEDRFDAHFQLQQKETASHSNNSNSNNSNSNQSNSRRKKPSIKKTSIQKAEAEKNSDVYSNICNNLQRLGINDTFLCKFVFIQNPSNFHLKSSYKPTKTLHFVPCCGSESTCYVKWTNQWCHFILHSAW